MPTLVAHSSAQEAVEGVAAGLAEDEARGALQHRHVGAGVCERRHEGDRGGTRADDGDALARHIEVGRPELRVDDRATEVVDTRDVSLVGLVVGVVAAAGVDEAGTHLLLAVGGANGERPQGVLARPVAAHDLVLVADVLVDAVLRGGVLDVVEDVAARGDGALVLPRLEGVGERVHVGVGANTGVTEQIPGAAERRAAFEDRVLEVGHALGEAVTRADSGEAGADDDDVEHLGGGFVGHGVSFRPT